MKKKEDFFEIYGFYLGSILGSIVYLLITIKMFFIVILNLDIGLAKILEIASGCITGEYLFLLLSARIGQIVGQLICKYVNRLNSKRKPKLNLLNTRSKININRYANVIFFPKKKCISTNKNSSISFI